MRRAAAVCVLAGSLAGCASGGEALFSAPATGAGSTLGNLLSFGTPKSAPVATARSSKDEPLKCPEVEVLDGTSSLRTFAGADQGNGNVRYQYSMGDVARECSRVGNDIMIKVGVSGRVLLGPAGAPGNFTVPVRIAIRRDSDQKAVAAKLYQVPASVAFGQTQGEFTLVSDPLAAPFTQAHADEDYTILVGFDAHPTAAEPAKPSRRQKKANPG